MGAPALTPELLGFENLDPDWLHIGASSLGGAFAERIAIAADRVVLIPESVDDDDAAKVLLEVALRAILLAWPPYGPWEIETRAATAVGATLEVVDYDRFVQEPFAAEVVLNAGGWPLPMDLLDRVHGCRCTVGYGVGLDWIDVEEATRRGITVVRMPFANTEDVATHTLALLLACTRRLLEIDRGVRTGGFDWPRTKPLHRLRGRRLGLLAYGNIARRVAQLAVPLGVEVTAHDPYVSAEVIRATGATPLAADELLATSQLISVHLPSTEETRGFLDARRIALLQKDAVLVVTSRGDVYDADALAHALAGSKLAAAGLDVFPDEPLPIGHPLTTIDNVILTPHMPAGYSEESIGDQHNAAAAALAALARGETPDGAVNAKAVA